MSETSSERELRAELADLLSQSEGDYGRILELSHLLAQADRDYVRFSADSGLISRLGEQLVARQETALCELVKNSYDADASYVRLVFGESLKRGGRLFVADDGSGMDRQQVIDGFMRLASTSKIDQPVSPRWGRRRAGRKGIGRFATQRLGKKLRIVTQTQEASEALSVTIDWADFERGKDLLTIANRIEEVPKERRHGTTLIIDDLRESWSEAQMQRVYRYLLDLMRVPASREAKTSVPASKRDPGFSIKISKMVGAKETEVASEDRMVLDRALAVFSGRVDGKGRAKWMVESKRLGIREEGYLSDSKSPDNKGFQELTNVSVGFKAYYFIWEESYIPRLEMSRLRRLGQEQGGIKLYRNGFRVLPYGEPDDDWLGLDETYAKRSILVPVRNSNFFGYVEIDECSGEVFEETSSREGVLRTDAFDELVEFVSKCVLEGALRVSNARGTKGRAGARRPKDQKFSGKALKRAAEELASEAQDLDSRAPGSSKARKLRKLARDLEGQASRGEEIIEEISMLRVLGGLGLTIGIFAHEVRHRLWNILDQAEDLLEEDEIPETAKAEISGLKLHAEMLRAYAAYFDNAIAANISRELEPQDLGMILYDFMRDMRPVLNREGIDFAEADIREADGLVTRPMHIAEWASILSNLQSNAIKAIKRRKTGPPGRIFIKAWREGEIVMLDFSDNGCGIEAEDRKRVFEAFYTTTAEYGDALSGTGLGLKIIKDIIESSDGEVEVVDAPKDYVTTFRFHIPSGEEEA